MMQQMNQSRVHLACVVSPLFLYAIVKKVVMTDLDLPVALVLISMSCAHCVRTSVNMVSRDLCYFLVTQ